MGFYSNTDRRFAGLEIKVGIFAVIAMSGLLALLIFVVKQSDFFAPTSDVFFYVKSGEGIKEGMPVKLSGFTIGWVGKLDLWSMGAMTTESEVASLEGLRVRVTLNIKTRHLKWIPMDSEAFLRKENVIGDQIIEIKPGTSSTMASENSTLLFSKEKTLNDYFEEISAEVKKVQEEAKKMVDYINNPEGEVKKALNNFHTFSVGLVETREKITQAFVTIDDSVNKITDEVIIVTVNANNAIDDLNKALGTTNTALPKTFKRVDESLDTMGEAIDGMKKLTSSLSETGPQLMESGLDAADDVETILDSLKKTWPINKNISPKQSEPLEVESFDSF